jgi:DNA-directed RNA polymerase specialized sigma24 family protein
VDEAWVDDLAQEAFIVAFRRVNEFEIGTDFGKWLRSVAARSLLHARQNVIEGRFHVHADLFFPALSP